MKLDWDGAGPWFPPAPSSKSDKEHKCVLHLFPKAKLVHTDVRFTQTLTESNLTSEYQQIANLNQNENTSSIVTRNVRNAKMMMNKNEENQLNDGNEFTEQGLLQNNSAVWD